MQDQELDSMIPSNSGYAMILISVFSVCLLDMEGETYRGESGIRGQEVSYFSCFSSL